MKKKKQSVKVEDTKFNKTTMKDKNKSRMDEIPIKEEDHDKSNISKKERKTLIKDIPGFSKEDSS